MGLLSTSTRNAQREGGFPFPLAFKHVLSKA